MIIIGDLCLSRHILKATALYLTQQGWKCLPICNRQYTEFHISNFEIVSLLAENLDFSVPWDLSMKEILITKSQKSSSTQSDLSNAI